MKKHDPLSDLIEALTHATLLLAQPGADNGERLAQIGATIKRLQRTQNRHRSACDTCDDATFGMLNLCRTLSNAAINTIAAGDGGHYTGAAMQLWRTTAELQGLDSRELLKRTKRGKSMLLLLPLSQTERVALLTEREMQVINLRRQGKMLSTIARELCISACTVRGHYTRICDKLQVPDILTAAIVVDRATQNLSKTSTHPLE